MVLLFFLLVIYIHICMTRLLLFSFTSLVLVLILHTDRACVHSFSLPLSLFFFRLHIYVQVFYADVPVHMPLLSSHYNCSSSSSRVHWNEEKKKVKIEDDDYDHRLAWYKNYATYLLYIRTEIQWTQDIIFRQVRHNIMITYRISLTIVVQLVYQTM
jgi:hypothetical protein